MRFTRDSRSDIKPEALGLQGLIPDASLASLIPIQIGTLHAQVCKFGHQWKYMVSFVIMKLCNHASSLDSADVINDHPLVTSPQIPQSSVDLADYSAVCAS